MVVSVSRLCVEGEGEGERNHKLKISLKLKEQRNKILLMFFKVIEMAEIEGLAPELATTFFKKKVYSSVMEYQVDCSNLELSAPESGEPLIANLLMKCITDYKIPIQQVGKSFISFPFKHEIHMHLSCNTVQFRYKTFPKPVYFE